MPTDGNTTNNSASATTTTTTGTGYFSLIAGDAPSGSVSFPLTLAGVHTSAFAVKYQASTPYTVTVVRARIDSATDNAGNVV